MRQYFEEWVAAQDGFTDSSFNKNLVTISLKTFSAIIEHLAVADFEAIQSKFEGELAPLEEAKGFKDFLHMFGEEFAKSAGRESGAMTVQGLAHILILMFSGNVVG